MRSSISVQSCASVPPAPALSVTIASPPSYSPVNSASSCSASISASSAGARRVGLGRQIARPRDQLEQRRQVADLAVEAPVGVEFARARALLGTDTCRAPRVVPEAGRGELPVQLLEASSSAAGSKVITDPGQPGPQLLGSALELRGRPHLRRLPVAALVLAPEPHGHGSLRPTLRRCRALRPEPRWRWRSRMTTRRRRPA